MGRFKIYDPQKLVKFESGSNYGECLLCERKLKNIMGNIKRHYEKIHNICLSANTKKSRNKSSKCYDDDGDYKICRTTRKCNIKMPDSLSINKIEETGTVATNTTVLSNIGSGSKNYLFSTQVPTSNSADGCRLSERILKRKYSQPIIAISSNKNPVNNLNTTDQELRKNSLSLASQDIKTNDVKLCESSEANIENDLPAAQNLKKIKLDEDIKAKDEKLFESSAACIENQLPVSNSNLKKIILDEHIKAKDEKLCVSSAVYIENQLPISNSNVNKIILDEDITANDENLCAKYIENQLPAANSNPKNIKLDEENDEIQIPCHSYINNIQISSLESCRQVEFLKCLVETKTQVNIPLKNFQKGGTCQKALQNWKQNFQFNYSSQSIGEHIDRMAKRLRQEIIKMVANRMLYLKLDIVSSKQSNVMLVNIQFIKDFEIKVVTLSALELLDDDLATYLKQKVLTTLELYQIDISRVYSITRDNITKNVPQSIKCNEDCLQISSTHEENDDTYMNPANNEYCQNLSERFPGHAIHFVACDIIRQLNENISQSRDSIKKLRHDLSLLNIKQIPSLDNSTTWFSVYDMINSLLNIREIVESNKLCVEVDWLFASKFIASFKPIVDAASMLQKNSIFVMGDFYREWLLCDVELREIAVSNELALYLLESFRKREKDFFENASFLAALYLDSRFCYIGSMYLNIKQKEMAISHLLQIFNKVREVTSPKNGSVNLNDRYLKLEKHTKAGVETDMETVANCDTIALNNVDQQSVKESLEKLQFEERLPINANILDYWKMVKYKSPILAKIAEVALAVPSTQATINRALNASSIMKGSKLYYESPDIIENLLLLRLNKNLVDNITLET